MPLRARRSSGGLLFHVFNRSAKKLPLFDSRGDYAAFLEVLAEAQRQLPMRLACYCVMPNHWHMALWPKEDGDLSRFMARVTRIHAQRWRSGRGTVGQGAVYQGRYKAVPVQCDRHFLILCRYIERNPVRAGLVSRADQWEWSSAAGSLLNVSRPMLCEWPVPRPPNWDDWLVDPEPADSLDAVRDSVSRSVPWGTEEWRTETSRRLGAGWVSKPRGRPRKTANSAADVSGCSEARSCKFDLDLTARSDERS